MKDRILQIMQKEGLTNADFAKKIGISTSSLSHIFSGRNNPSLDVVMCIHKACPYVNLYWLLYGEGEMEGGSENPEPNSGDWLPLQSSENLQNPASSAVGFEFRKENGSEPLRNSTYTPMKEEVKYIEKPAPKITEIRIFFDNGTYQVFKPES